MLRTKYIHLLSCTVLSLSIGLLSSCTKELPEYVAPPIVTKITPEPISIEALRTLYQTGGYTILRPIVITGQVITDDTDGNFYKTLHIQDKTGGIELKMAMPNMSLTYKRGSMVFVRCEGLRLGKYGGVINLGYPSVEDKYETSFVPELMVPKVLLPGKTATLYAQARSIADLQPSEANTLIRLNDVQFVEKELGSTWADPIHKDEPNKGFVERTLTDRKGNTIAVRTSSFARFAGKPLPIPSGSIVALLTFFNGKPQLVISSLSDVDMQSDRFVVSK